MLNGPYGMESLRPSQPVNLTYPADLECGTHLGRARRAIAEAGAGRVASPPAAAWPGAFPSWERDYDVGVKAMLGISQGYPGIGVHGGSILAPREAHRLDRLVSDLVPASRSDASPDESVYDTTEVDADLSDHLGALRKARRDGKGQKAVTAMTQVMQRLAFLANPAGATFQAKCAALAEMTDMPSGRASHLVGNVGGRNAYDGPPPAGTIAFADSTLEAVIFRLIKRGLLGHAKPRRHASLRAALLGSRSH